MTRIAINGMGRMGKLVLRALADAPAGEVVLLNDIVGTPEQHALWLEFDSVHGRWGADIAHDADSLTVNGQRMRLTREADLAALPLAAMGIDLLIECTGKHKTGPALEPVFAAGVRNVLVSAPVKDGSALNLVYGVNHGDYDTARHRIVTAASCTTNCIAPVIRVLHEEIGIRHGSITTIHDVTNTQVMVDRPLKDSRRARSGLANLIPTSTGSATAITLIYPDLAGRIDGHAVRVPLLNASLTDCVFELARETSAGEINALLARWAEGPLWGILGLEMRPLVSADYRGDPRSAIVDGLSTMVVAGTQAKLYVWYDNEWGYACRMADLARMIAASLA